MNDTTLVGEGDSNTEKLRRVLEAGNRLALETILASIEKIDAGIAERLREAAKTEVWGGVLCRLTEAWNTDIHEAYADEEGQERDLAWKVVGVDFGTHLQGEGVEPFDLLPQNVGERTEMLMGTWAMHPDSLDEGEVLLELGEMQERLPALVQRYGKLPCHFSLSEELLHLFIEATYCGACKECKAREAVVTPAHLQEMRQADLTQQRGEKR